MILVTGAGGVLGTALVSLLRREDEAVHALTSREVDLRDRDATAALMRRLRPRIVYHLAAKVHGLGGNRRFPGEMFADNMAINMNVVDAARDAGVEKIVAAGTVAIYASEAPQPVSEDSVWVGPPHASEAAYGHAKRGMLAMLEAYRTQYGLAFAYPVLTNIYGPRDRFDIEHGHVVPSLVAKCHAARRDGGALEVWGSGIAQRDFLHADDAARALRLIAERHDGAINVATGATVPIRAVVERLAAHAGVADIRWDGTKPDGQIERSYDVGRLAALGFVPSVALGDGLAATYDWYAGAWPEVRA